MKYFAIALIFGLFAISQAMPVEESREKRFNSFLVNAAVQGAKSICDALQNGGQANNFVNAACDCLDLVGDVGNIIGSLGDESKVEDQKRFFFNPDAIVEQALKLLNGYCSSAGPEMASFCSCAPKILQLG